MSDDGTLDLFADQGGQGEEESPPASGHSTPRRNSEEPEDGGAGDATVSDRAKARAPTDPGELPPTDVEAPTPAPGDAPAGADPDDGPRVWSVSEVNRAVRRLLEDQVPRLWVGGEVGGWKRARSGHCYFTLKDDQAQLRCVMWRRDAQKLPVEPEDGMEVRVLGYLTLYEARGDYQLSVTELRAEGDEGLWRLAFEKLRKELAAEGLLDPARKRRLPRFPRTIGVVTSPTGAAFRDILHVIRRRAPWTRVVLRGARVQGDGAAAEVADAIRVLGSSGLVEVLIVGRGGGSIEDLWAFNEEPVARAIAACPIPVISAVGHEVDVTISDLVADVRAPTPSAAAETAVQDQEAILQTLRVVRPRLARGLRRWLERRWRALEDGERRIRRGVERILERRSRRLETLAGRLDALSPLSTLARGYAVPLGPDGDLLRSVEDFEADLRFSLRIKDGRVDARVLDTEEAPAGAGGATDEHGPTTRSLNA